MTDYPVYYESKGINKVIKLKNIYLKTGKSTVKAPQFGPSDAAVILQLCNYVLQGSAEITEPFSGDKLSHHDRF